VIPKKKLAKKAADIFDLPGEAIGGLPSLEISGLGRIRIENHKGLLTYSEELVEVSGGKAVIKISGSSLDIRAMTADLLIISGEIFKIEFIY
jgi:sporulation protein YqfC